MITCVPLLVRRRAADFRQEGKVSGGGGRLNLGPGDTWSRPVPSLTAGLRAAVRTKSSNVRRTSPEPIDSLQSRFEMMASHEEVTPARLGGAKSLLLNTRSQAVREAFAPLKPPASSVPFSSVDDVDRPGMQFADPKLHAHWVQPAGMF